jgi:probable Rubsico expression protein CbbX
MTVRLPRPGLSLTLLVVLVALLLGWWRLSTPVFMVLAITTVTISALVIGTWDAWHQTQADQLASRGIYPDDRTLAVYDPGLRREFTPMIPEAFSRRMALRHTRPGKTIKKAAPPPATVKSGRGRTPAALAPAFAPARARRRAGAGGRARGGQPRERAELLAPDATVNFAEQRRDAEVDDLFAALDRELIGLVPVKKKVEQIGALLLVDRARQRFGLSATRPNLHMCFTGAPGTGKTTVALMMADLLQRLGYLDTGQLVHAMRDDLVGEYIGQTAPKTKYVLSKAMGGVLFIDEAYSLFRDDDSRDYGQECVDILMQVMENHRHQLVVIMAGYKDRMEVFFESNPGMRSRLAHHLDFADYQADELLAIGELMLGKSAYYLSAEATEALRGYLSEQRERPEFANARSVRNALEFARLRHAYRLTAEPDRPWSKDDLMRLEPADVLPSLSAAPVGGPPGRAAVPEIGAERS